MTEKELEIMRMEIRKEFEKNEKRRREENQLRAEKEGGVSLGAIVVGGLVTYALGGMIASLYGVKKETEVQMRKLDLEEKRRIE